MNIEQLLRAAEYIERRERGKVEAEHGYASTAPMPEDYSKSRRKAAKRLIGNRTTSSHNSEIEKSRSTHNELEKNRRAHLRHCMERLKYIVPLGGEASRHTTLGLLTRAKSHIKMLEDRDRKHRSLKDQLNREHRYLKRRLDSLTKGQYRIRVERSFSECSSSTVSTTSAASEPDEVDILGYGSSTSDTDDHSSIGSNSSDGGCAVSTRRLHLDSLGSL